MVKFIPTRRSINVYHGTNSVLKISFKVFPEKYDLWVKYVCIGFCILKDWEFGVSIRKVGKLSSPKGLEVVYRALYDQKAMNYYRFMTKKFCEENRLKYFGEKRIRLDELEKLLVHRMNLLNLITAKTLGKESEDYRIFCKFFDVASRYIGKREIRWKEIKESVGLEKIRLEYMGDLDYNFIIEI